MENENRLAVWYDRTIGKVIPRAHFFAMLLLPLFNILLYSLTQSLMADVPRGSMALPIDGRIPLIEEWVLIYFGCYAFWFGGLGLAARQDSRRFYGFFVRAFFSLCVAYLCFIFFPLSIDRPEILGDGIFSELMRFLYAIDPPHNLFPSLHCFFNWIVYIQIRGQKNYPLFFRIFACVFSFGVFASTLFTRQHYLLDVVAGVLLAELSGLLLLTPLPRMAERLFASLNKKVFTKK